MRREPLRRLPFAMRTVVVRLLTVCSSVTALHTPKKPSPSTVAPPPPTDLHPSPPRQHLLHQEAEAAPTELRAADDNASPAEVLGPTTGTSIGLTEGRRRRRCERLAARGSCGCILEELAARQAVMDDGVAEVVVSAATKVSKKKLDSF